MQTLFHPCVYPSFIFLLCPLVLLFPQTSSRSCFVSSASVFNLLSTDPLPPSRRSVFLYKYPLLSLVTCRFPLNFIPFSIRSPANFSFLCEFLPRIQLPSAFLRSPFFVDPRHFLFPFRAPIFTPRSKLYFSFTFSSLHTRSPSAQLFNSLFSTRIPIFLPFQPSFFVCSSPFLVSIGLLFSSSSLFYFVRTPSWPASCEINFNGHAFDKPRIDNWTGTIFNIESIESLRTAASAPENRPLSSWMPCSY